MVRMPEAKVAVSAATDTEAAKESTAAGLPALATMSPARAGAARARILSGSLDQRRSAPS
jgi:hypothetical protein